MRRHRSRGTAGAGRTPAGTERVAARQMREARDRGDPEEQARAGRSTRSAPRSRASRRGAPRGGRAPDRRRAPGSGGARRCGSAARGRRAPRARTRGARGQSCRRVRPWSALRRRPVPVITAPPTPNSVVMIPAPATRNEIASTRTQSCRANAFSSPPKTRIPPVAASATSEIDSATGPVKDVATSVSGPSQGKAPPPPAGERGATAHEQHEEHRAEGQRPVPRDEQRQPRPQ